MTELAPIDVSQLDVVSSPCNVRRDLHVFVRYTQEHEVKRLHRNNQLGKSDALQLAKLMSDPEAVEDVRRDGQSSWVRPCRAASCLWCCWL